MICHIVAYLCFTDDNFKNNFKTFLFVIGFLAQIFAHLFLSFSAFIKTNSISR